MYNRIMNPQEVYFLMTRVNMSIVKAVGTYYVAVSCGYDKRFAAKTCDGLCHLTKTMGRTETPSGFQSIA